MNKKVFLKLLKVVLSGTLVIICVLYLSGVLSYSSYESNTEGEVLSSIALWKILINDENITDTYDKEINIDDIVWDNTHTDSGKVSPGSNGVFTLEINPTTTDTAFLYDILFIDKSIDDNYVLTITSITSNDGGLIRTDSDKYSGLFSLNDIKNNKRVVITVNLSWINKDENSNDDTNVSDTSENVNFIDINFRASQYHGESINEYNP